MTFAIFPEEEAFFALYAHEGVFDLAAVLAVDVWADTVTFVSFSVVLVIALTWAGAISFHEGKVSSTVARETVVLISSVTALARWMALITRISVLTSFVTCGMAWCTDTVIKVLVHGAVAQAAIISVTEVANFTADVSNELAEVALLVAVVVEVVDESFEVVDHTESRSKMELHVSVRKDHMLGLELSNKVVVDVEIGHTVVHFDVVFDAEGEVGPASVVGVVEETELFSEHIEDELVAWRAGKLDEALFIRLWASICVLNSVIITSPVVSFENWDITHGDKSGVVVSKASP